MPTFGTKNALLGCSWAENIVIFEISTLKFVKNYSLSHAVNFGIGSSFSIGPGSAFSEDPGPGHFIKYALPKSKILDQNFGKRCVQVDKVVEGDLLQLSLILCSQIWSRLPVTKSVIKL